MKAKAVISSVLSEFSCIFPKWDFLPGGPRIADPWEFEEVHEWEIGNTWKSPRYFVLAGLAFVFFFCAVLKQHLCK